MPAAAELALYGFRLSGHSHRAELMLNLLGLAYQFHQVDLARGEQATPAFRALNTFGTVPVLRDGDVIIPDLVAIIVYLALKYDLARRWLPEDPVQGHRCSAGCPWRKGPCSTAPAKRGW